MDLTSLRKQRRELAHRRRRIIYNNDSCDCWAHLADDQPSAAEFLARRTSGLEHSQVDTISYNSVNMWDFGTGRHNSRVCDVLIDGKTVPAPQAHNHPRVLVDGKDCIDLVLEFCRRHDIEMWVSVRLNPFASMWYVCFRAPFKADHPERWIGRPPDLGGGLKEKLFLLNEAAMEHPDRWGPMGSSGAYYCADYGHPEVRQRLLEQVREICENYDLDGVEFDMLRNPICFKPSAEGQPDVGQANRDLFTGMMREIRTMTEEIGLERSRPIVIAARIPDHTEYAAACGLETVRWLQEQLIDIVVAGEDHRIRPWKETVALCRKHDVSIYAAVTESWQSEAHYRGKAHAAWAVGVDGVYTYNVFDPNWPLFNELGDPDRLALSDRIIPVVNANISRMMDFLPRLPKADRFLARPPRLPLKLPVGETQTFEFEAAAVDQATPHVQMELLLHNLEDDDTIELRYNGHELDLTDAKRDTPQPGWIVIPVARPLVRDGDNQLEIMVRARDQRATAGLALADLLLRIKSSPVVLEQDSHPANVTDRKKNVSVESTALYYEKYSHPPVAPRPSPVDGALVVATTGTLISWHEDAIEGHHTRSDEIDSKRKQAESILLVPPGRVTAQRQWLLDELNPALPRVLHARDYVNHFLDYPADPVEAPLPAWHSLAVLFDTEAMGLDFEQQLGGVLAERLDPAMRQFAGPIAATPSLAAIAVASDVEQDLVEVADQFAAAAITGILPRPIRFLWAWEDGNLIARTFGLMSCERTHRSQKG